MSRDESGRFIVRLPFRDDCHNFENSFDVAKNYLLSLENRFSKDAFFKQEYFKVLFEYGDLNHMSIRNKLSNVNFDYDPSEMYFIPHGFLLEKSKTP